MNILKICVLENYFLLLDSVIIFLSFILNSALYIQESSRSPDYDINYNYLLSSRKSLLMKFHMTKIVGLTIIKALEINFYGLILQITKIPKIQKN